MRRLSTEQDIADLAARLRTLTPDAPRQWGRMSCPQMVCHVWDAFRGPLGERPAAVPRGNLLTHTVVKWVVIRTPLPWVRGAPTTPDIDQVAGKGTPPAEFSNDVNRLLDVMRRFIAQPNDQRRPHPVFGRMNASDWARWGWAHVDHHLRQFGA
jgi:Protein of unknown function (DUF1569)